MCPLFAPTHGRMVLQFQWSNAIYRLRATSGREIKTQEIRFLNKLLCSVVCSYQMEMVCCLIEMAFRFVWGFSSFSLLSLALALRLFLFTLVAVLLVADMQLLCNCISNLFASVQHERDVWKPNSLSREIGQSQRIDLLWTQNDWMNEWMRSQNVCASRSMWPELNGSCQNFRNARFSYFRWNNNN